MKIICNNDYLNSFTEGVEYEFMPQVKDKFIGYIKQDDKERKHWLSKEFIINNFIKY